MRVAYFGGSFDPPHPGHLHTALAAQRRLGLDRILLAPTGLQPLKHQGTPPAPFADRVAMVELLVANHPGLSVSTIDAPRPGNAPNYSAETLSRLRPTLAPGTQLFFLAGADTFLTLRNWQSAPALLLPPSAGGLLDGWIVAARPGFPLDTLGEGIPEGFSLESGETASGVVINLCVSMAAPQNEHQPIYLLPDLDDPSAATRVRAQLASGDDPGLTPEVLQYIRDHALYRR